VDAHGLAKNLTVLTGEQGMALRSHPLRLSVHFFHIYPLLLNTARLITASIAHGAVALSRTMARIQCALRFD
jgi:hypothetical protein